jgi:hypothetical protein
MGGAFFSTGVPSLFSAMNRLRFHPIHDCKNMSDHRFLFIRSAYFRTRAAPLPGEPAAWLGVKLAEWRVWFVSHANAIDPQRRTENYMGNRSHDSRDKQYQAAGIFLDRAASLNGLLAHFAEGPNDSQDSRRFLRHWAFTGAAPVKTPNGRPHWKHRYIDIGPLPE